MQNTTYPPPSSSRDRRSTSCACSSIGSIPGLAVTLSKYPSRGACAGVPGAEGESNVRAEEEAYDEEDIVRRLRLTLRINLVHV
jgi:hypothetical protein